MKYVITGYKFDKEFTDEREAKTYFDKIKKNFTYCELTKVDENATRHYGTSIEIFTK